MSRTVIQLTCDNPKDSETVIKNILRQYNYELKEKDGEEFYQCGVGALTAPKFIKYTFNGNQLTLKVGFVHLHSAVNPNLRDSWREFLKDHVGKPWMTFKII